MTLRGKTSLISPNLYDKSEPNPTLINSTIQCSYSKVIGMNKVLDFNIYMLNVRIKFLDLLFLFVKAWFPITMTRGCVMKTKFNLGMSFNVGDCLHYQSVQEVCHVPLFKPQFQLFVLLYLGRIFLYFHWMTQIILYTFDNINLEFNRYYFDTFAFSLI